ncbi:MAG TPA: HlyD family efflux transporter periplasmic adaptor subunit [Pirellulaceae bacterium]|nr:HlyD family efflux transporter periplasmic adaptor subunit [Pirellulaceae bacterium]
MTFTTAMLVTALALAAPPVETSKTPGNVQVKYCLVTMIDHVKLSSREAGPIVSLDVVEGAVLKKKDLIAQLDDSDSQIRKNAAQFEADVASEQASSDVNVRAAEKMADVAKAEYEQAVEINKRSPGVVSETEVRRLKLTYERGLLQIEVAQLELNVAKLTAKAKLVAVDVGNNEIERRKIIAPMDCVVDRVLVKPAEWVQPGQPIVELVRIDRLRVEAFLNAYEVSPRELAGREVEIEIPTRGRDGQPKIEKFSGKIGFVSNVVVADGAYRVTVDFDNRKEEDYWVVQPGLTANMMIKLGAGASTPVSTSLNGSLKPSSKFVPPSLERP